MVRAAIRGQVDFSCANRFDSNWRLNLAWRLQAIDRQESLELYKAMQQRWLSYATSSTLSQQSLVENMRYEQQLFTRFFDLYTGKRDKPAEVEEQQLAKTYREMWSSVFGDPDDPAVKKSIEAAIAKLNKLNDRGQSGRSTRKR